MSQKYLKEDDQLEVIKSIEDIIGDINEKWIIFLFPT